MKPGLTVRQIGEDCDSPRVLPGDIGVVVDTDIDYGDPYHDARWRRAGLYTGYSRYVNILD